MNPTLKEKIRYQFDNYMAKGTVALIGGLGLLSLALIILIASFISLTGVRAAGSDALPMQLCGMRPAKSS